ncbi:MAG TPA: Uma2 family endonuclease [Vicinamibacterales bacterium]|nr:Uma2 family endonuclease [Vicinamibacterales bacterium]
MAATLTRRRFTADEYYRMAEAGILSERDRVELIDGEVVAMTPIGARHAACVTRAARMLDRAAAGDAIVPSQNPVRLDLYHEPEPDVVLVRPRADFYASFHPRPADILLVVEITDSSLEYDRDVKSPMYAAAGIPEYWLADLDANVVWRYSSPRQGTYRVVEPHLRGQSIAPYLLQSCVIAVDRLLTE